MTYADLLAQLLTLDHEQLKQDVTITAITGKGDQDFDVYPASHFMNPRSTYPCKVVDETRLVEIEDCILDEGHPYLTFQMDVCEIASRFIGD